MKLAKKEIQLIADLARLQLTDKELGKYGQQLSGILDYIDQLKEVDTNNIEITSQAIGLADAVRNDETENWNSNEVKNSLKQAVALENQQIKVKKIL